MCNEGKRHLQDGGGITSLPTLAEREGKATKPVTLSIEEALAALPDGEMVHTFVAGFAIIGADWPRESIIAAIHASPDVSVTGPMAQAMGHGIAIQHPDTKNVLFVATRHRTDRAATPPTGGE